MVKTIGLKSLELGHAFSFQTEPHFPVDSELWQRIDVAATDNDESCLNIVSSEHIIDINPELMKQLFGVDWNKPQRTPKIGIKGTDYILTKNRVKMV